ncbi:transporter [Nitrobacter sp. JJSN]|uniref:transporter n=1 Tax=Nitrobacter sp. JJSN TaxID=3453033 RepID=UPI003F75B0E3
MSGRSILRRIGFGALTAGPAVMYALPAIAGPPYQSDDPEPTDYRHYEIYTFNKGVRSKGDHSGASGIDFNYGAAPDLQLTATLPVGFDFPSNGRTAFGLGNIELAAKYRLLHQDRFGLDVAVFPRVFLPSGSRSIGDRQASLLLPIWVQKDWGKWSAFGGGGCQISAAGRSHDFCIYGGTLTRQVLPELQLGVEVFHQTADRADNLATTSLGIGAKYDLNQNIHLLGYAAKGIQNARTTNQYSWYTAILFTF